MKFEMKARLLASALVLAPVAYLGAMPVESAQAQRGSISFRYFHRQLRDHGDWYYSDRWGEVWQPYDVRFRPYRRGYWVNTDEYGWYWVSSEPYGEITYHYGRWVNDPDDGWLWIPGYVWSPAWVVWRQSGDYIGWMPMPPDRRFLEGDEFGVGFSIGNFSVSFNSWNDVGGYYGYSRWYGRGYGEDRFNTMWTFVPNDRFGDREVVRFAVSPKQLRNVIRQSRNVTNYTVVNNFIVNKSVTVKMKGGAPFTTVKARDVVRSRDLIAPVSEGRDLQRRIRSEMPRGNGEVNSAPKPNQAELDTLSSGNNPSKSSKRSKHLLDKTDAAAGGGASNPTQGGATTSGPEQNDKDKGKNKDKDKDKGAGGQPEGDHKSDQDKKPGQQGVTPGAPTTTPATQPTEEPKKNEEPKKEKKKQQDETNANGGGNGSPAASSEEPKKKKHDEQQGASDNGQNGSGTTAGDQEEKKKKKHEKAMPADSGAPPSQGTDTGTPPKAPTQAATPPTNDATTPAADEPKHKKKKKDDTEQQPAPQQQ